MVANTRLTHLRIKSWCLDLAPASERRFILWTPGHSTISEWDWVQNSNKPWLLVKSFSRQHSGEKIKTPLAPSRSVAIILIFNQCPSIVFVVKHLSFCQYGRVRCSPTNVAQLLSSAFHNIVLSPRFPTWKNNSRNSISTNTLRVLLDKKLGNQVVPTSCDLDLKDEFRWSLLKMV